MVDQCELVLSLLLPVASCTGNKSQRGELIHIQCVPAAHAAARFKKGGAVKPAAVLRQISVQDLESFRK